VTAVSGSSVTLSGAADTLSGSGVAVWVTSNTSGATIYGNDDVVDAVIGATVCVTGIDETLNGSGATVSVGSNTSITVNGPNDTVNLNGTNVAITTAGYAFSVSGTAAEIIANLGELESLATGGHLGAISFTDGGTPTLALSVAQITADFSALSRIDSPYVLDPTAAEAVSAAALPDVVGIDVNDSSADVVANLNALESLAASGRLAGITLTDGGDPSLTISAAQFFADSAALALIDSPYLVNDNMYSATDGGSGMVVSNSLNGDIIQNLPPVSNDTMQFLSIDGLTYGANLASAESLGLNPSQLRDYDGNLLGGSGQWVMQGLASVRADTAPSYILTNPTTGRWAEVAVQPNGTINMQNNGAGGDTRIAGIYIDPLVALGLDAAGGPFDSQTRFLSDVKANRLELIGSAYDPQSGLMDLMFKQTNVSDTYLRAILWADGNIEYANYMNTAQLTTWATGAGVAPAVQNQWLHAG
jgi:hypothetical protein